jgi:ArsR family transcriptional regulator, arsenate/arsenite/antimonite-responsive transcriptional repressor
MKNKVIVMRALGDEVRLRIINLLVKGQQMLCVCEFMDALKMPQYAVSKVLSVIRGAGLIKAEKRGTWVYYGLDKSSPKNKQLFSFLEKYLTDGIFNEDELRLNGRLLLRDGSTCVVGIVPEKDLLKMIREKELV